MPNIVVHLPQGAYAGEARAALTPALCDAATKAEQMPADPRKQFVCWIVIHEAAAGSFTCAGVDVSAHLLPCLVQIHVPAGVLDDDARTRYVRAVHDAFLQARPAADPRQLFTSVVLNDVVDGTWGASGVIWRLPALAKASGFAHLQHLVAA